MFAPRHLPFVAIAAAILADLLLYDAPYGLGTALACALCLAWLLVYHRAPGRCLPAAALCIVGVIGMMLDPGPLDALLAIVGLLACAAVARRRLPGDAFPAAISLAAGALRMWVEAIDDLKRFRRYGRQRCQLRPLLAWIVPIAITAIFALLFGLANPVIEGWWNDISSYIEEIDFPLPGRMLLWLIVAVAVWGLSRWQQPAQKLEGECYVRRADAGFMLRTLLLCNLLFAMQHLLDLRYLLFGASLPAGMSYAGYAQRGAYPLLATAILAALFVLLCLRPGGPAESSKPVRIAVAAWLGQNVLLCATAIWRLALYIEAYGLTRWRLAALLWIGLVALGLSLIVLRMLRAHDNRWLINRCVAASLALLGLCALADCDGFIANWNVERECSGRGQADVEYLTQLGPAALPALHRLEVVHHFEGRELTALKNLEGQARRQLDDWRGWNWRCSRAMD